MNYAKYIKKVRTPHHGTGADNQYVVSQCPPGKDGRVDVEDVSTPRTSYIPAEL